MPLLFQPGHPPALPALIFSGGAPPRRPPCVQVIWITLLPLTLWESCGWAMLPLALLIAFLLLGGRCRHQAGGLVQAAVTFVLGGALLHREV